MEGIHGGVLMQGIDWAAYDHFGLAAIVLAGTLVASWILSAFIFSEKNRTFLHSIRGVAPPFINIIGTLFALTLAFLANDTWSAHDRATNAVYREADSLKAILSLTLELPEAERTAVHGAVADYARSAVEAEWPLLSHRQADPGTAARLDRLLILVSKKEVGEELGLAVHTRVHVQVGEVRDSRDQRIALSQTHVNPLKWLGMAFLGFVTMLSVAAVHVEQPRAALVAILLFAAAAAPTAAIVLVQGNPFQQPTTVSPAPIIAVYAK